MTAAPEAGPQSHPRLLRTELAATFASKLLFASLAPAQHAKLAAIARPCEFAEGVVIIRERDYGESLFVIAEGVVDVLVDGGTGTGPIRVTQLRAGDADEPFAPGDFFGEMCLLDLEPRAATVVARTRTSAWEFNRDDLYWLFGDDKELQLHILTTIARVLSRHLSLLDSPHRTLDVDQRLKASREDPTPQDASDL